MKKTFVKPEMELVDLRLEERVADCNCKTDGPITCTCCIHSPPFPIEEFCCPHCCTCDHVDPKGSEDDFDN